MLNFIKQVYKQCLTPLPARELPIKAGLLNTGELVIVHPSGQVQIYSAVDRDIINSII